MNIIKPTREEVLDLLKKRNEATENFTAAIREKETDYPEDISLSDELDVLVRLTQAENAYNWALAAFNSALREYAGVNHSLGPV
jgi:hypothetical protein